MYCCRLPVVLYRMDCILLAWHWVFCLRKLVAAILLWFSAAIRLPRLCLKRRWRVVFQPWYPNVPTLRLVLDPPCFFRMPPITLLSRLSASFFLSSGLLILRWVLLAPLLLLVWISCSSWSSPEIVRVVLLLLVAGSFIWPLSSPVPASFSRLSLCNQGTWSSPLRGRIWRGLSWRRICPALQTLDVSDPRALAVLLKISVCHLCIHSRNSIRVTRC